MRRMTGVSPFTSHRAAALARALFIAASLVPALSASPAEARTITVTMFGERNGQVGGCSLREAIQAVNNQSTVQGCGAWDNRAETIRLSSGTYTVRLASPSDSLTVNRPVMILGKGYAATTITDGSPASGNLFVVTSTTDYVSFRGIRIDGIGNGHALVVNPGALAEMTFSHVTASGSEAASTAGCIFNQGTLFLKGVEVFGCRGWGAGSIGNWGQLFVTESAILGTAHGARGGAIGNDGSNARLYMSHTTIAKNFTSNYASALKNLNGAYADLSHVTIVHNQRDPNATGTDTVSALRNDSTSTLRIKNSLISNNLNSSEGATLNPNCFGNITSLGYNYLGESLTKSPRCVPTTTQPTDTWGGVLELDKDSQNMPKLRGGVTRVYVPTALPGNAVVARIPDFECLAVDQRGVGRRDYSNCEMGAANRAHATLIVGNAGVPDSADTAMGSWLQSLGFDIYYHDDDWAESVLSNPGLTVAILSSSVSDSTLGTKYRSAGIGVVVNKPSALDNLEMVASNGYGIFTGSQPITMVETTESFHLKIGNSAATSISGGGGGFGMPLSATWFAYYNSNSWPAIFAQPKGSSVDGGFVLPAGRIAFPGVPSFFTGSATTEGKKMFEEAVFWATRNR
jgi:CSLREA domain-containing protein